MTSLLFTLRYRRNYAHLLAGFAEHPVQRGDVVFLGDSITQAAPWEAWFPDRSVRNQGISGDTARGVLKRVGHVLHNPAAVFLMIGTNDVGAGRTVASTVGSIDHIVATIREAGPSTNVFVHSVLPRSAALAAAIGAVNDGLAELCLRHGATYVDCFGAFADEHHTIRPEFSDDALHLLPAGYEVWRGVITPLVAQIH